MSEIFISVDVETSGPIPGPYSLLSIGACLVEDTTKSFYTEIKPICKGFVEQALEISGLSLEKLEETGLSPEEAMAGFESWVKSMLSPGAKPIFFAYNCAFDWMFTHWYFIQFLGRDPFGFKPGDIPSYLMGKMDYPKFSMTGSDKLDPLFRVESPHTHNALDDAREQAQIFKKILEHVK